MVKGFSKLGCNVEYRVIEREQSRCDPSQRIKNDQLKQYFDFGLWSIWSTLQATGALWHKIKNLAINSTLFFCRFCHFYRPIFVDKFVTGFLSFLSIDLSTNGISN